MNNKNSVVKILEYIQDKGEGILDIRENLQVMSDELSLSPGTIAQVIHRLASAEKLIRVKPGVYEIYSEICTKII